MDTIDQQDTGEYRNMKVAETTVGDLRRQGCQIVAADDFEGRSWEVLVTGWAPVELFDVYSVFRGTG